MIQIEMEEQLDPGHVQCVEIRRRVLGTTGAIRWILVADDGFDRVEVELTDRDAGVVAAALLSGPFAPPVPVTPAPTIEES